MDTVPYYQDFGDTCVQFMAKDVGEDAMAHAQEDDFLVDGDQLKREQGVGQQHVYPDLLEE